MLLIDPRFNGPPRSAHGGYTCGLAAGFLGASAAEVTLRLPPPLGRELTVTVQDGGLRVCDREELVAEAVAKPLDLDVPSPVPFDGAVAAAQQYPGFERHAFPTCFVCGPARDDGLRLFAGAVEGREVVACPWQPEEVTPELVWAALDCPGAIAVGWTERGETLLGRFHARVDALPNVGERCVVAGWPLGEDGRKLYAGTALYGEDGAVLARARATWIVPG